LGRIEGGVWVDLGVEEGINFMLPLPLSRKSSSLGKASFF